MSSKIFIVFLNIFAIKLAFSQTIYNASPTCSYPSKTVSTVQSYPVGVSPASAAPTVTMTASALPSNVATATKASSIPTASISAVTASPIASSPIATIPTAASPMPIKVSPIPTSPSSSAITEAKAYFVPGPIPDPKITILGDMPAVVEVTPKIYPDSPAFADPGCIEVKATMGKNPVSNLNLPAAIKPVLPAIENSPMNPIKRLTMACANDDSLISHKASFIPNQPVCPGISKIDPMLTPAMAQDKMNNPIDFDGLMDGFMTCL